MTLNYKSEISSLMIANSNGKKKKLKDILRKEKN